MDIIHITAFITVSTLFLWFKTWSLAVYMQAVCLAHCLSLMSILLFNASTAHSFLSYTTFETEVGLKEDRNSIGKCISITKAGDITLYG